MQLPGLLMSQSVMLLIFGSLFVALHCKCGRAGMVAMLGIGMISGMMMFFLSRWLGPYILLLIVFGLIIGKETTQKIRVIGTLTISLVMLILPVWFGLEARSGMYALQAEYPIVSLGERLSYEETAGVKLKTLLAADTTAITDVPVVSTDTESVTESAGIVFSSTVQNRMEAEEYDTRSYNSRSRMLEQLHNKGAAEFAVADGFGITRRLRPNRRYITLPEPEPIPFEESESEEPSYLAIDGFASRTESPEAQTDSAAVAALSDMPARSALHATHQSIRDDFLDSERFGYVASPQQIAGFEPHAFQQPARVRSSGQHSTTGADHAWSITRLELVSLLKFDEPRVYVSDVLPNMEELDQTRTRPLSAFEAEHLPQLVAKQDVVIQDLPDEIRMLGSLRATKQCMACHSVKRGYLLGAFSYTLKPGRQTHTDQ